MLVVLRTSWPLLFGMLLLLMGNGVQGTLLGIRGGLEGIDAAAMSLVMPRLSRYFRLRPIYGSGIDAGMTRSFAVKLTAAESLRGGRHPCSLAT